MLKLRTSLKRRGAEGIRGLARHFKICDVNGNGSADFQPPGDARAYYAKNLVGPVLITLALQVLSAACFVRIEGWGFGIAIYHSLVTATTVGAPSSAHTTSISTATVAASSAYDAQDFVHWGLVD